MLMVMVKGDGDDYISPKIRNFPSKYYFDDDDDDLVVESNAAVRI